MVIAAAIILLLFSMTCKRGGWSAYYGNANARQVRELHMVREKDRMKNASQTDQNQ